VNVTASIYFTYAYNLWTLTSTFLLKVNYGKTFFFLTEGNICKNESVPDVTPYSQHNDVRVMTLPCSHLIFLKIVIGKFVDVRRVNNLQKETGVFSISDVLITTRII
jgi:hypothetical protein